MNTPSWTPRPWRRLTVAEKSESLRPIRGALDVLAQVVVALCVNETWKLEELYDFVRTSWAYHRVSRKELDLVLDMLAGRYDDTHIRELTPRLQVDRLNGTVVARPGARYLLARAGGVIPDRGYYNIRLQPSGAMIGQLDEEFVWERRVGDRFSFGAQAWRIERIGHNDVEVTGAKSAGMPPFWRGEAIDRDFELCEEIGLFLAEANERLDDPEFERELRDRRRLDASSVEELLYHLRRQVEATGVGLPHRHHVVFEHFSDPANSSDQKQVIFHAPWGGRILRPLSICLQAAFDKRHGLSLELMANDEGISLNLPHSFGSDDLLDLVPPEDIESLLRWRLESTGFFGARFRENAACALLLPRQHPKKRLPLWLNRLRAKKLMHAVSRYDDFPIMLETWRGCLRDHFDLDGLRARLGELADGTIRVSEAKTTRASPFASDLVWRGTDTYMYQDDTPQGGSPSRLTDGLIADLLSSATMRPRLAFSLCEELTAKLQRTHLGYAPADAGELYDLVAERVLIVRQEWDPLIAAMTRDHGEEVDRPAALGDRIGRVRLPGAADEVFVTLERLPGLMFALGLRPEEVTLRGLDGGDPTPAAKAGMARLLDRTAAVDPEADADARLDGLVSELLRFYGPVSTELPRTAFGVAEPRLAAGIHRLREEGLLVCDLLSEGAKEAEVCDAENLERLLRMARAAQRPSFEPLPLAALPLFEASLHGLTERGDSEEALRSGLERLFGFVAPAVLWESEILPARLATYHAAWLDSLLQQSDLVWFGAGEKRVGLAFEDWVELFTGNAAADPDDGMGLLPSPTGRFGLEQLRDHSGLATTELTAEIWQQVWSGRLSNDTFASLRSGITSDFEAPTPKRPQRRRRGSWRAKDSLVGSWFALPAPAIRDALQEEEANRDRVRQLFSRYGVLFRERLAHEESAMGWRAMLRTLRLMEFSGEAVAGHFFSDIQGLQFVDPAALRRLQRPLPEDAIYWLNATDPISLCGAGIEALKGTLPARLPSNHLVYRGRELAMVSHRHGRRLDIRLSPDHEALPSVLEFFPDLLGRVGNSRKTITVEEINDQPAPRSPYLPALRARGFALEVKTLVLSRSY